MLRLLLRGPARGPRWRWLLSRICARHVLLPLVVMALAAAVEVWLHNRHFAVRLPERELDEPFYTTCQEPPRADGPQPPRENAALVMLARNRELAQAVRTVQSVETHFNQWFHYPIVFLNDEPWSDEFVAAMRAVASGETRFEVIPRHEWTFPPWMDADDAKASIADQGRRGILYAGMETYHHMCRFYSGNFYMLQALKQYKWYWRIEPDVDFYCAITYDPFAEMAKHNKVYGFTIALWETASTCPSLFREVSDWKERHRISSTELWKAFVAPSWVPWPLRGMMAWFWHRDRFGDSWSLCHYWSNFEIADLDFFRASSYQNLFKYLDETGGFYYERWGDAAVHSLAVAMLLDPQRVHHFADFGYRHDWFFQCPNNAPGGQLEASTALPTYPWAAPVAGGIGCRCECDGGRTGNHASYCLHKLKQPNTRTRQSVAQWALSWWY